MKVQRTTRDLCRRYGVALALASIALLIRAALPVPEGTAIYQLPIVAVVLAGWIGGRGPALFASLICATVILYRFIPPANKFDITPDYAVGFFVFIGICLLLSEFSAGRRRAEHDLRASEARFRTFVDRATDAFFLMDERLNVIDVNRRACETLGRSREELIGMHPGQFDVELDDASIARLAQRASAGETINFETRHQRKDGSTFPVEIRTATFREAGKLFYLALARDISERKLAEEERHEHLRFLDGMDRVNRAIHGTSDLDQVLDRALDQVLDIFQCDRASLGRHSGEVKTTSFTLLGKRERPGFVLDVNLGVEVAADEGVSAMSAELRAAGGPVQWVLGSVSPETAQVLERFGVRSVLSIPIELKSERQDHFYVFTIRQCTHPRIWTPQEVRLALEIGRRLGDATKMLSTLQELRASERKLVAAQRIARVGWWERDYATGRVALSDEACRIFGVEPVDLPQWQERWSSLIHPDDRQMTIEASEIALRGGPRYDVEYRVVRPDGSVRVVHSNGDVTRDESGRPVHQFGVMQDITELRRAEGELRVSEARFRTFVDRATDAFFLLDEQLNVVDVNRQACEALGRSREELMALHPRDFDVGLDESSFRRLAQRAVAGEIITFETRHRHKEGKVFPVEVRTGTFEQGGRRFYLALARDISERKLAEESLRQNEAYLAESQRLSHTGSWALDVASDRYVYTSEEFKRIFGLDGQAEALTRKAVLERMHPEDRGNWALVLDKSVREKADTTSEYRILLPDGRVRHIHTIRHPLVNSAGEVVQLVGTSIDITERKQVEEERERHLRLEAELAHANRVNTLGELTASIAHEVNQPLGAMVTSAAACLRWLTTTPPNMEEARSGLEHIVADGKRAGEIIKRVRALTKREPPSMELLDINLKISQVIELAKDELRSRGVVLRTDFDATLPRVTGDRIQLQQVILNLILNATDAMSGILDRPRELKIVTARSGTEEVQVEVRDSGPGVPPNRVDRIFDAFYTTKAEGIGIGLSISRSIVEAHGGRLWAGPNEPYGAVFRLSLPIAQAGIA